jgi:hypothetical protein
MLNNASAQASHPGSNKKRRPSTDVSILKTQTLAVLAASPGLIDHSFVTIL